MIIPEKIEIKITHKCALYYNSIGYVCKGGDLITINNVDLPNGSNRLVNVECDICGTKKSIKYQKYYKNISNGGYYACSEKCSVDKRQKTYYNNHGIVSPFQCETRSLNIKKSNIENYGCENAACSERIKSKIKNTCLDKYGVDNPMKSPEIRNKRKSTCLKKYGYENPAKSLIVQYKMKKTCLKKYGVEYALQSNIIRNKIYRYNIKNYGCENVFSNNKIKEKIKQTNIERYGVENPSKNIAIQNKIKNTCLERYGVNCVLKNDDIKSKIKQTNIEKYGVENPLQNINIYYKQLISSYKIEENESIGIYYQSSYELDFLSNYKNLNILNGLEIEYFFDGKVRKYYSDFYLPDYNLIVEIKSTYTFENNKQINLVKSKFCIEKGYDFIFVIDKDYTELNKKIASD